MEYGIWNIKFSKVSAAVNSRTKSNKKLTFENSIHHIG